MLSVPRSEQFSESGAPEKIVNFEEQIIFKDEYHWLYYPLNVFRAVFKIGKYPGDIPQFSGT